MRGFTSERALMVFGKMNVLPRARRVRPRAIVAAIALVLVAGCAVDPLPTAEELVGEIVAAPVAPAPEPAPPVTVPDAPADTVDEAGDEVDADEEAGPDTGPTPTPTPAPAPAPAPQPAPAPAPAPAPQPAPAPAAQPLCPIGAPPGQAGWDSSAYPMEPPIPAPPTGTLISVCDTTPELEGLPGRVWRYALAPGTDGLALCLEYRAILDAAYPFVQGFGESGCETQAGSVYANIGFERLPANTGVTTSVTIYDPYVDPCPDGRNGCPFFMIRLRQSTS